MLTAHTATPWHVGKAAYDFAIYGPKGEHIATLPTMLLNEEIGLNAAFIAHAANCHDELLAALEDATESIERDLAREFGFVPSENMMVKKLCAAIAKAKGSGV